MLTPYDKAAEFFGFWGMTAKLAAVFGLLGLGLLQAWVGLATAIVFCLLLFMIAFWTALSVNEQRGQQQADAWSPA
jgi:UMF1 family MFS transporter